MAAPGALIRQFFASDVLARHADAIHTSFDLIWN